MFLSIFAIANVFAGQELLDTKEYKVIKVTLDDNTTIKVAYSSDGTTLQKLMDSVGWSSAVNGAYFCPQDYPQCGGINTTTADRVSEGNRSSMYRPDLGARGLFALTKDNDSFLILNNGGYVDWINRKNNSEKMKDIRNGISNFPVLLVEWQNVLSESESLLDSKMKTKATKTFICNVSDNEVYMWQVYAKTIYDMPKYLIDNFGCVWAINLDGGWSMWMIYKGAVKNTPGRLIMDAFVVVESWSTTVIPKEPTMDLSTARIVVKRYVDKNGTSKLGAIVTLIGRIHNLPKIFVAIKEVIISDYLSTEAFLED